MSLVKVENLAAGYGMVEVLRNISLEISTGEVVAVLGSNGVGKTTLNNCLSGLIKPKDGKIFFEDKLISDKSPEEIVDMGLIHVPEGRKLFPNLTVKDNLELGSYRRGKNNRSSNLENVLDIFPRLSERISQTAGTLSGGEQQMVAIGRGLMGDPRLLLLDEPTEGIQPSIIQDIGRAIRYLRDKGEMAIVLVEQYFEFAHDLADNFVVMDRGVVVLSGIKSEVSEADVRRHLTV